MIGRIASGLDFTSAGTITFYPPDGFAWFHIDNGPAGGRDIGRLRVSFGENPGDNEIMTMDQAGRVGIGTQTPTERLDVDGNIVVNGDIALTGADCAEEFSIFGDEPVCPGTVMVATEHGGLEPCREAYDRRVTGVVTGAAGLRPGIVLGRQVSRDRPVAIGLIGRVHCLVDADSVAIHVGDLLTTSDIRGHAMKAVDAGRAFGAVLGKALRPLAAGRSLLPILIALQ